MLNETACVVGGAGAVGQLFCQLLLNDYKKVKVIDLNCNINNRLEGVEYITGDISSSDIHFHLETSRLIILSLPEDPAMDCITSLSKVLKTDQCLIETTSVKTKMVSKLQALNAGFEILSINPMFGPSLGFNNQSVACVDVNAGPIINQFKQVMQSAGAAVIEMTAEEHDRSTAITQVATHAAIIAFGLTLKNLNYDSDKVKPIWTPPHKTLMALITRVLAADPEVYRDIQLSNPYAVEARNAMSDSLIELSDNVDSADKKQFSDLFQSLEQVLGSNSDELAIFCQKIFK